MASRRSPISYRAASGAAGIGRTPSESAPDLSEEEEEGGEGGEWKESSRRRKLLSFSVSRCPPLSSPRLSFSDGLHSTAWPGQPALPRPVLRAAAGGVDRSPTGNNPRQTLLPLAPGGFGGRVQRDQQALSVTQRSLSITQGAGHPGSPLMTMRTRAGGALCTNGNEAPLQSRRG